MPRVSHARHGGIRNSVFMENSELERRLSAAMIRLRARMPFFAALALFARMRFREDIPTAATDGRDVFWNPAFLESLTAPQLCGVLLHEVLHAALLHVTRRMERDPIFWNIAADIVVNGMIAAEIYRANAEEMISLPEGVVRDTKLEAFSVEEVYELILKDPKAHRLADAWRDLLTPVWGAPSERAALETHWRAAQAQARTLFRAVGRGNLPAELQRELAALEVSQLDWRSHLWRFLVRTPTDFSGFDRRFIGRGLYLEQLEGESLRVFVAADTSGSVDNPQLAQFLSETQGILRSYPHILCDFYYADAAAYGPYRLEADTDITAFPKPVGGGGTDFRPFFAAVAAALEKGDAFETTLPETAICVYLTDGHGTFPDPPPYHTLWVVTVGGLDFAGFPFGETVRLLADGAAPR